MLSLPLPGWALPRPPDPPPKKRLRRTRGIVSSSPSVSARKTMPKLRRGLVWWSLSLFSDAERRPRIADCAWVTDCRRVSRSTGCRITE
eukprot:935425-Alexandrium_andersonii.AAC.1